MKKHFILLIFSLFFNCFSSQNFRIPNDWKGIRDDNELYKEPNYNDSDWQSVKIPELAEVQFNDPNFSGFAWYRISFDLDKSFQNKDLMLDLGVIDDSDETYFNGVLIGKTGKFPPNDESAWDINRKYKIPKGLVKEHNVLAIKFYDGLGNGGLYKGNFNILRYDDYLKQKAEREKNKHSYNYLTTSNGLISAVYNSETDEIEAVYPHIFKMVDSLTEVKPFITNLKTNRKDKPIYVKYKANTHIIEVKYNDLIINYFASFTRQNKVFYVTATGKIETLKNLDFNFPNSASIYKNDSDQFEKKFVFYYQENEEQKSLNKLNDFIQNNVKFDKLDKNSDANRMNNDHLLESELAFMRNLIEKAKIPKNISDNERDVMEQAVSILKMSQVSNKEIYPKSHGQILASLRPGVWAIAWVRDGAYAIEAMAKLGMYDEARKGLEFMLKADGNKFKNYVFRDGKNYGPEVDYQISLTRYFGNGTEECDFNENGPNIEYDDWGLFLTAFNTYVKESNDWEFFHQYRDLIQSKVADPIIAIIQKNGLLKRDSGPWEHHLPGNQYAFTNGVCAVGLEKFVELLKHENLPFEKYENAYKTIYNGVMNNLLVDNKFIKGNATDQKPTDHYYFDGATLELFANGFVKDKNLFQSHMQIYDQQILVNEKFGKNRGYIRFNSSDSYENQEWPFAGLRVAIAEKQFGFPEKSKKLIDRITEFANANYNVIPEILTNDGSEYSGSIPMIGYGSGAYALAIIKYYENR